MSGPIELKRVFISHNYVDAKEVGDLLAFFAPRGGSVRADPVVLSEDVSAGDDSAVEEQIRELIDGCTGVLILVGEVSHNRRWSEYEVRYARGKGLPVTGVRKPHSTAGPPNEHPWLSFVDWSPERVAAHIADWKPVPALTWTVLDGGPNQEFWVERAPIRGGWLVRTTSVDGVGLTFVPDPEREW